MKDWWKTSAIGLAGCLATVFSFWLTTGVTHVTRNEVSAMIVKESPYTRDQQLILKSLERLNNNLDKNNDLMNALNVEIAELRSQINN